nr:MAG TPA_asm: hypothetical protein [Caudoviricetes sp.]
MLLYYKALYPYISTVSICYICSSDYIITAKRAGHSCQHYCPQ